MSSNGDNSLPCYSDYTRPLHLRIFFLFILSLAVVAPPIPAGSADITFKDSQSRLVSITEHFVGFPDVGFDVDSITFDGEAERNLQFVVEYLKAHPEGRVWLEGHVDDHYSKAYGLVLSGRRADLVKRYLCQHGVINPIQTSGYSNGRPFCREQSEKCRRKNNRVHILVIESREIPKPTPVAMSAESHGSAPRASEPATVEASEPAQSHSPVAKPFDYPTVYFQRNSFQLDKKAQAGLAPLVDHLKSHPDLQIQLNGHVDETHTQAYGFTLSGMRVDAVNKFLQAQGVKNAIKSQAWGKDNPICFERSDACYRLSNQVDVVRYSGTQ